jgi:large subunit ribosomal protein L23
MSKTIALRPRLNEKTYGLAASRVYVFDVERGVNKHGIARAVEAQFDVKVLSVNTTNIGGKAKRVISITGKRMKNAEGTRSAIKKAYVTLAEGNSLPFFNAIEEEEQKEQAVQEKVDKAVAKQADKDSKKADKDSKPRRGFRLPKKSKAEEDK